MTHKRWLALWIGFLALVLMLHGQAMLASAVGNWGMMGLRDALVLGAGRTGAAIWPGRFPLYQTLPDREAEPALLRLRQAATMDPGSTAIQWALGRAALAVGDFAAAIDALAPLAAGTRLNPLLYQDTLIAFGSGGKSAQAIALYESLRPPGYARVISDTMALAYIQTGGSEALEKAWRLRPGDLYVNYQLWTQAQQDGHLASATDYSYNLTHFPIEALAPADERVLDYAAQVIPALLEEGVWERNETLNAVSFLVWRYNQTTAVERLLQQLIEGDPDQADWLFYLAELYHRRGDRAQAEAAYQHVLAADPAYVQAYLRLGMVAEASSPASSEARPQFLEAAAWYEHYHRLAPADPAGLKAWADVLEALGDPQAATLREEWELKRDDRHVVAGMLGVPVESVEVGPNLVRNAQFENWEGANAVGWRLGLYLGPGGDCGLYSTGSDGLVPEGNAAAILTLWGEATPDGARTYAEYIGEALAITDTMYVVSLDYSSSPFTEGNGLLFLGDYVHYDGIVLVQQVLPPTHGQWCTVHVLADGVAATHSALVPLVRNWGGGEFWFRGVQVKPVSLGSGARELLRMQGLHGGQVVCSCSLP